MCTLKGLVNDRWELIIALLGPCWWDFVTCLQMQLLNLHSSCPSCFLSPDHQQTSFSPACMLWSLRM